MKMNEFDRIIREKMNTLNPEYAPETWDLLEQKLDATEAGTPVLTDEEAIDEVAFAKLHQFETDYRPEHWQAFAERLDEEAATTNEVLRYKLVEISIMLLLLLTLGQYLPLGQYKTAPHLQQELPTVPAQTPAPRAESEQAGEFHNSSPAIGAIQTNIDRTNGSNQHTSTQISSSNNGSAADQPDFSNIDLAAAQADLPIAQNQIQNSTETPAFLPPLSKNNVQLAAENNVSDLPTTLLNQQTEQVIVSPVWNKETLLASLEALELESLYPSLAEESLELFPPAPRKRFNIRIGMQGSPNYDRIITPPTEVDEDSIVSLDRYSLGYTGGLSLGVERGRWEVETGLFYAAKSYQPLSVLYVTGSVKKGLYGEGAKDFEFNTVYLPLKIRYNYLQKDSWRLFVMGGISMHTVVQANYYLADQDGFRSSLFAPAPVPRGEPERPEQVEEYDLNKGLFQGGGLWENSYFSANVGLGIEKYLTGRLSIFSQANYAHSFYYPTGGIGPFLDRFHTTSLVLGIKVTVSN